MSLCNLCKEIPWENLPTVPPDLPKNLTGQKYIQPVLSWPPDVRGHPHHQSLEALRQSSSNCDLCSLIRESAENVHKELEELEPKWKAGETMDYGWPTWEMWLMKREEGGDGCWVMSFVGSETERAKRRKEYGVEEAWIIAALGICVREGDALENVITGRAVEESARSPTVIERARKWLDQCNDHPTCKPENTPLPSRVIDVGELNNPEVRLWEPVPEGTMGKYISLSYCWGTSREFTTTRTTIEDRKRGIRVSDMPKTYQDIILLTREFGVRYLWLDSLCICQDEHEDWERESAKMLSIYFNAYLTIAASNAKESAEGFLGKRSHRTHVQLDYVRGNVQGKALAFSLPLREELVQHEYIVLEDEPLSKRAWGLQERVISHRLLIYGTHQMFFECNEGYRGEDGLYLPRRHDGLHKVVDDNSSKRRRRLEADVQNNRPKRDIVQGWYNLLWLYGPKKLSYPSDKLPAASGLARRYAELIESDYLAGLWRTHLLEGLVWQSLSYRRVSEYRAPSWSWASGDGIPASGMDMAYEELAEILDAQVTLKGENPYGEVSEGRIKLRAPLEQLFFLLDGWDPEAPGHYPYENNVKVRTAKGDPEGHHSRFDFAFTADDAPKEAKRIVESLNGVDIFALILIKSRSSDPDDKDGGSYHSLIVRKVDGTDDYQRLGFLLCGDDILGRKPEQQPKEELSIITLV